jgi:hypothetical protein
MALKFNLEYLSSLCKDTTSSINTLRHYYTKHPVRVHGIPATYDSRKMYGESFLVNPLAVFDDRTTDPLYIRQYINLAGRRDYAMYKLYGIKYLDLSYYPDLDISKIKHNPLLKIAGNKLYFKYEETLNGNRIQ